MKKLSFLLLAISLSLPLFGFAQEVETEDFDGYIARLNTECPIGNGEKWALLSFAVASDTVVTELQVPASLGVFMSLLTEDSDNVRRLWVREMEAFGETWQAFVKRLVEADRPLKLKFKPQDKDASAEIILMPTDFKKK